MKLSNQKLKPLYLMRVLLENTDDDHALTVSQLITKLSEMGIPAERKSLYDDIEQLRLFGLDICSRKARANEYFIGNRLFELPELKLLVDSVQSSRFITQKKSMELISKLETLTNKYNAARLHRQVFVTNRAKTMNEEIYYNVDKLHDAIALNKQIHFKYFDIGPDKKRVYRKRGELYTESPVALTWDDENYYLITYKQKYDNYIHYRVDKMDNITITKKERILSDKPFDLSEYSKSMFRMFTGEETEVSIRFENSLAGAVFDRFGLNIPIMRCDDKHFLCKVKVAVSPHFLAWIIAFGKKAKIISPHSVADKLCDLLSEADSNYI